MRTKISPDDMRAYIDAATKEGLDVGVRDLAYALLNRVFEKPVYSFKTVFSNDSTKTFQSYRTSRKAAFTEEYIDKHFTMEEKIAIDDDEEVTEREDVAGANLTFDEIKAGLEEDLQSLISLRDAKDAEGLPMLEPKDMASVVGRIADIRTKLVEKFGSTEKKVEHRVVVNQKYNSICEYCGHEIAVAHK